MRRFFSFKLGFGDRLKACLVPAILVFAVFVLSGVTTELYAQSDKAVATDYWQNIEFIDSDQATPILATFVDNLATQLSTADELTPGYYTMFAQHNFAKHVWKDCLLNVDVGTSLSNRYVLISEQASGTATNANKSNPGNNASNSFNPAFMEVVNLLKK